jgi:hypothetical protein
MTIDEMIKALEDGPMDYGPDDDRVLVPTNTANKIAAVLRAGQAMRNCFNPIDDDDGSLWATDIKRSDLSVAGLAWDEATKEEV